MRVSLRQELNTVVKVLEKEVAFDINLCAWEVFSLKRGLLEFWGKKSPSGGLEAERHVVGVFGDQWSILGLAWLDLRAVGKVVTAGHAVESSEPECEVCAYRSHEGVWTWELWLVLWLMKSNGVECWRAGQVGIDTRWWRAQFRDYFNSSPRERER